MRHPIQPWIEEVPWRLHPTDTISLNFLQEHFYGRRNGYRDISHDSNRTRLHCEPIHRQVSQPYGDVGQISPIVVQDHLTHLVPVSSCPDGRRTCSQILGYSSKGNACDLNSFLTELLKKKIKFFFKSFENFLQKNQKHPTHWFSGSNSDFFCWFFHFQKVSHPIITDFSES